MSSSRLLSTWAPVVLWAGLIFGLSSVPNLGTDLGTWDLVLRKLAHFAEYAVLGLLLVRALGREPLAAAAGVAYAATDELHQHFVRERWKVAESTEAADVDYRSEQITRLTLLSGGEKSMTAIASTSTTRSGCASLRTSTVVLVGSAPKYSMRTSTCLKNSSMSVT